MVFYYLKINFLNSFVIFETSSLLTDIFFVGAKFNRIGSNVNVIINDVINPKVIIQPKSIIGFISLKIKDKNAIKLLLELYKV